jgi:nitroreductase
VPKRALARILEAARWAPTAHNMQNFSVIVVDDPTVLAALAKIDVTISDTFVRENYAQLSFSAAELRARKTGLLSTMFPPSWRTRARLKPDDPTRHSSLGETMQGSPVILVVTYDTRLRAPASEGDVLGLMSLGCVMENMWLTAEALGIGTQIMSVFSAEGVESEVRRLLGIAEHLKIGFAMRLGYPAAPVRGLRVRRDLDGFAHHNRFGNPVPG